jgi:paraquat-inducible protein B
MSKKANPATVGAFVIGAVVLAIVGVSIFGSGKFFRETYEYILYFDSDVSGLSEGANVKLKGVQIGSVKKVLLNVGDMAQLTKPGDKLFVPVIIELDADKVSSLGAQTKPDPATVAGLIMLGLRAQLASESFVTGVLYVKLDLFPGSKIRRKAESDSLYPEIPTLPTPFEEAQQKAAQFFAELQEIDVKGLVEEVKTAVAAARDIIQTPGLQGALDHLSITLNEIDETLASMRGTSDAARGAIDPVRADLAATLAEMRRALTDIRSAATGAGAVIQPDSPLVVALQKTLSDAATTSKAVKDLATLLERQPDALLRGKAETLEKKP